MLEDILLAVLALALAVFGTLTEKLDKKLKIGIIVIAALTAIVASAKSFKDQRDKDFTEVALVSMLTPPNLSYREFRDEISKAAAKAGFDSKVDCLHYDAGMTCELARPGTQTRGLLVLDRNQVAQMYKSQIKHEGIGEFLDGAIKHQYPADVLMDDEVKNKIGILAFYEFYRVFGYYPDDYNWDDDLGIRISVNKVDHAHDVIFSPKELQVVSKPDLEMFYDLEKMMQQKFIAGKK